VPAIAGFGIYIAWQQKTIAARKLKHDLFDRRFAVFSAVREFLSSIIREGEVIQEESFKYLAGTAEVKFLFDEEMEKYLKEIWSMAVNLTSIQKRSKDLPVGPDRDRELDKIVELQTGLATHLDGLKDKFVKFMKLES